MGDHEGERPAGRIGPGGSGPEVTIVIPAYNEAHRLAESLPRLVAGIAGCSSMEIVIVDDGSTDETAEVAQSQRFPPGADVRVVRCPWNRGKGAAVRLGVMVARGRRIAFMDADMAADVGALGALLAGLDDAEVAIGSRTVGGAEVLGRSPTRSLTSSVFNGVVRALLGLRYRDTQCGFKAFRADEGKILLGLCRTEGFAFDAEVLTLADRLGWRVREVPVVWNSQARGHIRHVRDPLRMLADVLKMRVRLRHCPTVSDAGRIADGAPRPRAAAR